MRDDDGRDDNDRDGNDPTGEPPADTDSEREKQRRHFRKEKKLKNLNARVGPDLHERLKHEAERRESTKSALVCKVVADFLVGLDYPDDEDGA